MTRSDLKRAGKPPVLILGGTENALSLARSLGRHGIDVYAAVLQHEAVRFSRYCQRSFAADSDSWRAPAPPARPLR